MKVFQVQYEEDGATTKIDGGRATDIRTCTLFYAANHINAVFEAIDWLLLDEERTIMSVTEVIPAITVLEIDSGNKN
jgi:hypothetical protein